MVTIENIDELAKTGGKVLDEPLAYFLRAQSYIEPQCNFGNWAFGVVPSPFVVPQYHSTLSDAQAAFTKAIDAIRATGYGLITVANNFGAADGASAVGQPAELQNREVNADGAFNTALAGTIVFAGELGLLAAFAAANATLIGISGLAPVAIPALVAWAAVQPDEDAIVRAISGWRAIADDVNVGAASLKNLIAQAKSNWHGDEASDRFTEWVGKLEAGLEQLRVTLPQFADGLEDALSQIRLLMRALWISLTVFLAAVIAATALDAFFGAGEVIKQIQGWLTVIETALVISELTVIIGAVAVLLLSLSTTAFGIFGAIDIPVIHESTAVHVPGVDVPEIDWNMDSPALQPSPVFAPSGPITPPDPNAPQPPPPR